MVRKTNGPQNEWSAKRMVRKTNWGIRSLQSNNQSTNEAKTRQNAENQIVKGLKCIPTLSCENTKGEL
jgi:hypothetical protein